MNTVYQVKQINPHLNHPQMLLAHFQLCSAELNILFPDPSIQQNSLFLWEQSQGWEFSSKEAQNWSSNWWEHEFPLRQNGRSHIFMFMKILIVQIHTYSVPVKLYRITNIVSVEFVFTCSPRCFTAIPEILWFTDVLFDSSWDLKEEISVSAWCFLSCS